MGTDGPPAGGFGQNRLREHRTGGPAICTARAAPLTICPFTGKGFGAFLPKLNKEWFGWFVKQVEASTDQKSLFDADGATAHKAELFDSQKLQFEKLPAACPELNPVERFFREVRRGLKNRVLKCLDKAQAKIKEIVQSLFAQEGKVVSLTCFPYLKNATF